MSKLSKEEAQIRCSIALSIKLHKNIIDNWDPEIEYSIDYQCGNLTGDYESYESPSPYYYDDLHRARELLKTRTSDTYGVVIRKYRKYFTEEEWEDMEYTGLEWLIKEYGDG